MAIFKDTTHGQGTSPISPPRDNGSMPPPPVEPAPYPVNNRNDEAVLDEFEQLAKDTILDDDDGDAPEAEDEISTPLIVKNLPRFAHFRLNPEVVFELWGTKDEQGFDELLFVTTKQFARNFEDDVNCAGSGFTRR
jgi:hypothetical protein